ncbi:MAG: ABC transporter ATP-binding protein [Candidatus Aenigmarchaeota archaeon]|nr:ABC transporter ATP-binding protein [Candidatus Aenigmarchaeota archaeon]
MVKYAISAKSIVKDYGCVRALDNVAIDVEFGEIFGFLGPNGAGKTTMINILTGQLKATSGHAEVLGIDCAKEPVRVRANVGIVPEQENPPSFLTAIEYLHFVSKIRKIKGYEAKCAKWLELLDFCDQKNVLCKDLSRGTRQKVMIAQAFLHEPKVVFIDEPLINLDPLVQKKIKVFLCEYAGKGNCIFLSTHVLEIAGEICRRVAIIDKGKIIACDEVRALQKKKDETLENVFIRLVCGSDA